MTSSKIIRVFNTVLFPLVFAFSIHIIIHGHLTPGGGFQGGAVAASAFALLFLAYGSIGASKTKFASVESIGLLMFIVLGFIGLGTTFFYNALGAGRSSVFGTVVQYGVNPGFFFSGGTVPLMSMAVGLEVICGLALVIYYLGRRDEE